jgi:hypothetical protein
MESDHERVDIERVVPPVPTVTEIRTLTVTFPPVSGSGPQTASRSVSFPTDVRNATVGITGYSLGFVDEDHHLGRMEIGVESRIAGQVVHVDARLGLRDWSGNWDDAYQGWITAAVIADLSLLSPPLPTADVSAPEAVRQGVVSLSTEPVGTSPPDGDSGR